MRTELEHFPNLVAMFFARAAEKGDAPFLWVKREGQWRSTVVARGRGDGRPPCRGAEGDRAQSRRPGDAGLREPAGMADVGPRDHGRGLRDRAHLHHQYRARPPAHPGRQRRPRGDRLHPETGADPPSGGDPELGLRACDRHRAAGVRPGRQCPVPRLVGAGEARRGRCRGLRGRRQFLPRGPRLHHLHVRHGRRSARGDAASWRHPAQCRGLHIADRRGFRLGRRGVPVLPARFPRL